MQTQQLREYLGVALNIEKDIFMQERTIQALSSQLTTLGRPNPPAKPAAPGKPNVLDTSSSSARVFFAVLFLLAGIAALLTGIYFINMHDGVRSTTPIMTFSPLLLLPGGGLLVYCCGGWLINHRSEYKRQKAHYDASLAQYNSRLAEYNSSLAQYQRNLAAEATRLEQEKVRAACLTADIRLLQGLLSESQAVRKEIYDKNILFPKYRYMVAVGSIYEYLCSGRCSALEGHEGAYNIFETEARLDRIILQLDRVIQRLEDIRHTQYAVYTAIQEASQRSEQLIRHTYQMAAEIQSWGADLSRSLSELQRNSKMLAYRQEQTQKNTAYLASLGYHTQKYGSAGISMAGSPPRN